MKRILCIPILFIGVACLEMARLLDPELFSIHMILLLKRIYDKSGVTFWVNTMGE